MRCSSSLVCWHVQKPAGNGKIVLYIAPPCVTLAASFSNHADFLHAFHNERHTISSSLLIVTYSTTAASAYLLAVHLSPTLCTHIRIHYVHVDLWCHTIYLLIHGILCTLVHTCYVLQTVLLMAAKLGGGGKEGADTACYLDTGDAASEP